MLFLRISKQCTYLKSHKIYIKLNIHNINTDFELARIALWVRLFNIMHLNLIFRVKYTDSLIFCWNLRVSGVGAAGFALGSEVVLLECDVDAVVSSLYFLSSFLCFIRRFWNHVFTFKQIISTLFVIVSEKGFRIEKKCKNIIFDTWRSIYLIFNKMICAQT